MNKYLKKALFKLSHRDTEIKIGVFLLIKSILIINLVDIFILDMFNLFTFFISIIMIKGYLSRLIVKKAWYLDP
jgi:predicted DNA-binding transcriptional regulator